MCSQERGVHSKHCGISQNLGKKIFFFFCLGLSVLQNRNIPQFFGEDGIQQVFSSDSPSTWYSGLKEAFKDLEIQQVSMLPKGSTPVR